MLKIPKKVEYAFLALKHIAESPELVSVKEISESVNIPFELLAKILQKLNKAKIVESVQGTKGGYRLTKPAYEINLYQIIDALEQNVQMTDCMVQNASTENCKRVKTCCLVNPISKIQLQINNLLNELTLEKII